MNITEVNSCEVCGANKLAEALNLGAQPLCDALIPIGDQSIASKYPTVISFCEVCKTAHQRFQPSKAELFPENYHYRAARTPSVLSGMRDLVSKVSKIKSLKGVQVLDIGCNDGSLLNFFSEQGALTFGVDPTLAVGEASHRHRIWKGFFDDRLAKTIKAELGPFDIITMTNVFAHIENLPMLLRAIQHVTKDDTLIVIENHYLGSILDTGQFDTFYHEHPRTYSLESFNFISNSLGLQVVGSEFTTRYGGNIRVYLAKSPIGALSKLHVEEVGFFSKLNQMQAEITAWKNETLRKISDLNKLYGPLDGIAFPGRASILINILGLQVEQVRAIYEIDGSIKVYNYAPGTNIPILPEKELFARSDKPPILINFAWHIVGDVLENLKKNNFMVPLFNIKDPSRLK